MWSFVKGRTVALVAGLALLAAGLPATQAQVITAARAPAMGANPYFQIRPGLTIQQYAYNTALFGRALQEVPPYAFGVNPYAPGTLLNPGLNPYASLATNPYASLGSYGGGYSSPYLSGENQSVFAGYLRGAADVTNAQANFLKAIQESRLLKEQVQAEQIANRRRLYEEYLWKRQNLPTPEQLREEREKQEVLRSQMNPPATEVWSAKALNDLLADLIRLQNRAVLATKPGGEQFTLDPDTLKQINVTSAKGGTGNIGLLKNQGRITWPLALQGNDDYRTERNRLETLAQDAWKQAELGNAVDNAAIRQMEADVDSLRRKLTDNVTTVTPSQYMQAKRFLDNFDEAIKALSQPDAARYVSRKYAAEGKTVAALVDHMARNGLVFAPAVGGDEAAYTALHRALAAYSLANQTPQVASEQKPEK